MFPNAFIPETPSAYPAGEPLLYMRGCLWLCRPFHPVPKPPVEMAICTPPPDPNPHGVVIAIVLGSVACGLTMVDDSIRPLSQRVPRGPAGEADSAETELILPGLGVTPSVFVAWI